MGVSGGVHNAPTLVGSHCPTRRHPPMPSSPDMKPASAPVAAITASLPLRGLNSAPLATMFPAWSSPDAEDAPVPPVAVLPPSCAVETDTGPAVGPWGGASPAEVASLLWAKTKALRGTRGATKMSHQPSMPLSFCGEKREVGGVGGWVGG